MQPGTLSLIFFCIELVILAVVIIFNRKNPFFWSIVMLLALLQLYQLSEFLICIGIGANITGRIAFVIITFLPSTGYYLCTRIVGWKFPDYWVGFAAALGLSIYYLSVPGSVELVDCNPLYAIYSNNISTIYGIFYMGIIAYSILFTLAHMIFRRDKVDSRTGAIVIIGYLSFLAPMYLMIWLDSAFGIAIPSIMCKYALLLAVTLGIFSFIKPEKKVIIEEEVVES
ncbi:MAG: hypothetical protein GOP50_10600 [Candidatus Heimdallarchaeota archaeon]|nr:hypothetical protein [Candidatus Heimdallarchaeota archaeon]